jgi:hypothetical protein
MKEIELHTQPTFDGLPARKLEQLLADGWQINGYCIQKPNADGWKYGAITAQGRVLWWHDDAGVTAQRQPLTTAEVEQGPVVCKHEWFRTGAMEPGECRCIKCGRWNTTAPPAAQRQPDAYCVTIDGEYTGWLPCTLPEAEAAVLRLSKRDPGASYAFEPVYLAEPEQPDAVGWMVPGYKNAFNEWEEAAMYCSDGERPRALYPARSVAHEITGNKP